MKRVAITGGIGSGKSTVCKALSATYGAPIYDSDARAKQIMDSDRAVREALVGLFGPEAYSADGSLNRAHIAKVAFGNKDILARLNSIVHPKVVADFEQWAERQQSDYVILESALLFSSPLVGHYDLAVVVDAPIKMRIERCVRRDGTTAQQVEQRINNQMSAAQMRQMADIVVEADGRELAPQLEIIDQRIRAL